uniref:G protein nucleolar 3 like n=2 Tax=Accipitrinae TaxID=8955 RepID=A0A663FIR7_AQUCH
PAPVSPGGVGGEPGGFWGTPPFTLPLSAGRQVEAARKKRVQGKRAKAAVKKDPGVPQLGRFAAHVQQQNENRQKRAAEARRRREEARETEVGRRRSLAGLQYDALRRQREFERKEVVTTQPDAQEEASLRQYGRELRKVLAASDVVLEVLDARDPQGCRSPQLEAAVRQAGHRQRLVLVLNKIDLVPRDVVAAWLKYLRAEFPTVAFKACTQQQSRNLKQSRLPAATAPEEVLAGGACVGADCLLRVLANYSRSGEVKTTITVGVVGYPNVGKSSLINSLKRSRACGVGAAPGVTRCLQAVQLDRHIQLLDCPGVVMATGAPPAAAPLRGALAPQRLRDPLSPAAAILRRCPPEQVGGGPPQGEWRHPPPPLGGLGLPSWQLGSLGGLRPVAMATRGVGDPPTGGSDLSPWRLGVLGTPPWGLGLLPW